MPLLLRDGRLVVALDDPSRRAAIDEVEFIAQCKVVPVLARCRRSATPCCTPAYEKIGAAGTPARRDRRRRSRRSTSSAGDAEQAAARRSRRRAATGSTTTTSAPIEQIGQLAGAADQQDDHRGAQAKASPTSTSRRYPGSEKIRIRFRKDGLLRPTSSCRASYRNAHDRAHQDHVRPRHLRAPQAAGRQDQLHEVRRRCTASSCASRRSRPTAASRTS